MASSYGLSSTRNTTAASLLLRNSHIHLPRFRPHTHLVIPNPRPPSSSLSLSFSRVSPSAALSSYAEEESGGGGGDHQENVNSDDELPGVAEAMNISPTTAAAVGVCVAVAVLALPLAMPSLRRGLPMKNEMTDLITGLRGCNYIRKGISKNEFPIRLCRDQLRAYGVMIGLFLWFSKPS